MANIKDIAQAAGVSTTTVSRALAKPSMVKKATVDRVKAAVAALDYTPNALASSLRRKRADTIVVVVPDILNPFYSGIVQGIENVAHDVAFRILLGETKDQQARLDSYSEMLASKQADGLILIGSLTPSNYNPAATSREHMVLACEYLEGYALPRVRIDNIAASAEAVSYLIALGHERIATITGPLDSRLGRDRLQGFRDAMAKADLPVDESHIVSGSFTLDSGTLAMQKLVMHRNPPTAVFCANDEMAIGAVRALNDAGIWVPTGCSVVGFDDIRFARYASPPLTTVGQPNVEIGEVAMRLMLASLDGSTDASEVVLPHRLTVRASTARLGAAK